VSSGGKSDEQYFDDEVKWKIIAITFLGTLTSVANFCERGIKHKTKKRKNERFPAKRMWDPGNVRG
jgi:hypothetical protein